MHTNDETSNRFFFFYLKLTKKYKNCQSHQNLIIIIVVHPLKEPQCGLFLQKLIAKKKDDVTDIHQRSDTVNDQTIPCITINAA